NPRDSEDEPEQAAEASEKNPRLEHRQKIIH
ncbi:MAG: hypothetical protein ACI9YR_000804, partial [Bacteroidia bacterium]